MTPPLFRNRIRKVCTLIAATLILLALGLYLALPDCGSAQSITLGTLKGTYVGAFSAQFAPIRRILAT
jgi:hypothetical protein